MEREARPVTVHRFEVASVPGCEGVLNAEVDCSSGTYVRVLAADLGRSLGGGAHLRNLRRVAVGGFTLAQAHPVESPEVLPMSRAVEHLDGVQVGRAVAVDVTHGRVLDLDRLGVEGTGPWACTTPMAGFSRCTSRSATAQSRRWSSRLQCEVGVERQ